MPTVSGIVVSTSQAAADRRVFSEIIDELARPVDADDTTVRALAADAFRSAIRKFNAFGNWPWEIQEEEITVSADVERYTIQKTFKAPLALHYLDASGGRRDERFIWVPYPIFIEGFDLSADSKAWYYTVANFFETSQLILYPRPAAADQVLLTYYRETPRPRNENEAVEMPEWAVEVHMAEAWYEFQKRLPEQRRVSDLQTAFLDASRLRRRLVVMVNKSSDTVRVGA